MEQKFRELETAKENVRRLLDVSDALIDMHDLEYWAGVVVRLRKEIKEML